MIEKSEELLNRAFVTLEKVDPAQAAEICAKALRNTEIFLHEGLDKQVKTWGHRGQKIFKNDPGRKQRATEAYNQAVQEGKEVAKIRKNDFEEVKKALFAQSYHAAHSHLQKAYSFAHTDAQRRKVLQESLPLIPNLAARGHVEEALFWVTQCNAHMPASKQEALSAASNAAMNSMSHSGNVDGMCKWMKRKIANATPTKEEQTVAERVSHISVRMGASSEFLGQANEILNCAYDILSCIALPAGLEEVQKVALRKDYDMRTQNLLQRAVGLGGNFIAHGLPEVAKFWGDRGSAMLTDMHQRSLARQLGQKAQMVIDGVSGDTNLSKSSMRVS